MRSFRSFGSPRSFSQTAPPRSTLFRRSFSDNVSLQKAHQLRREAQVLLNNGQYGSAEFSLLAAAELYQKESPKSANLGRTKLALGYSLQLSSQLKDAERFYGEGVSMLRSTVGEDDVEVGFGLGNLAEVLFLQERVEEAVGCAREAVSIFEKRLGEDDGFVAAANTNLAGYLAAQEKYQEAKPFAERAVSILARTSGRHHGTTRTSLLNLSFIMHKLGSKEELKAFQNEWNQAIKEENRQIKARAAGALAKVEKEDIRLLESQWRATQPHPSTPMGFFLPSSFVNHLYAESKKQQGQ